MANNKDNNFGLPFDLPDYEDIETILDEMAEAENMLRAEYNKEKIRIAELRRARQVLENSNVPHSSETYIKRDAEIRRKEHDLTEKYKQVRQQAKPQQPILQPQPKPQTPRQVQAPQYAQPQRPKAPSYSVNTSESKPVATRTEYKPTRKPETDYESVAGWLLGAGGVAVVLWGGISINNWYSSIQTPKQEVQPNTTVNGELNETQIRRDRIQKELLQKSAIIQSLKLEIKTIENYDKRFKVIQKVDELNEEYRQFWTGLDSEDRYYLKSRPH
jgi:hypothetical protein